MDVLVGAQQVEAVMDDTEVQPLPSWGSDDELPLAQRPPPMEAGEAVLSDPTLRRATVQILRPYLSPGAAQAGQGSQAEEGAQGGQQGGAPQQRAGVRDLHEQRIQSRLELVSMQADVQAALHTLLGGAAEVPVLELPAEMLEVALKHPVLRMAVDRALEAAARRMAAGVTPSQEEEEFLEHVRGMVGTPAECDGLILSQLLSQPEELAAPDGTPPGLVERCLEDVGAQLIEAAFTYDTASYAAHKQLFSCCQTVAEAAADARRQLNELQSRCTCQPTTPGVDAPDGEPPSSEQAVERCRLLQQELADARQHIRRLEAQMSDGQRELLQEVGGTRHATEAAARSLSLERGRRSTVEGRLDSAGRESLEARRRVCDLQEERVEEEQWAEDRRAKIQALEGQRAQLEAAAQQREEQLEEAWQQCAQLRARVRQLEAQVTGPENQQLAEQLAASEAAAAEAQQQLEQERHRHAAELAAREAAAAAARKEAERERRRLACRLATSEETAGVARRELQREAQRRANQVAEGERAAAAAAESARKLEGKVARLRRQLQEEQQARAQQVLGIQQQQAGVARALGEHTAAVQRLEESTQRAATALQAQVERACSERDRLQAQVEELAEQLAASRAAAEGAARAQAELDGVRQERDKLRAEVAALQASERDYIGLMHQLQSVEAELEAAQEELEKYGDLGPATLHQRLGLASTQLQAAQAEAQAHKQAAKDAAEEARQVRRERDALLAARAREEQRKEMRRRRKAAHREQQAAAAAAQPTEAAEAEQQGEQGAPEPVAAAAASALASLEAATFTPDLEEGERAEGAQDAGTSAQLGPACSTAAAEPAEAAEGRRKRKEKRRRTEERGGVRVERDTNPRLAAHAPNAAPVVAAA